MPGHGAFMTTPVFKGRRRDSHTNFFHAVNFLESRLSILLDPVEKLTIPQVFQVRPPLMRNQVPLTFGRYLEDLDGIAGKYWCDVNPWAPTLREAKITPEMAYAMSVNFSQSAFLNMKNIAALDQLSPLVKDVHDLLKTYADFDHAPVSGRAAFEETFLRAAMMSFRRKHDQLSDFDEAKAKKVAARCEPNLVSQFPAAFGELYQGMFMHATLLKGREEGERQAQQHKEKALGIPPAGP